MTAKGEQIEKQKTLVLEHVQDSSIPMFFKLVDLVEPQLKEIAYDNLYEKELELLAYRNIYLDINTVSFKGLNDKTPFKTIINDPYPFNKYKEYRNTYPLVNNVNKELSRVEFYDTLAQKINSVLSGGLYPTFSTRIEGLQDSILEYSGTTNTTNTLTIINSRLTESAQNLEKSISKANTGVIANQTDVGNMTYYDYFNNFKNYYDFYIPYILYKSGYYGLMGVYNDIIADKIVYDFDGALSDKTTLLTFNGKPVEDNGVQLTPYSMFMLKNKVVDQATADASGNPNYSTSMNFANGMPEDAQKVAYQYQAAAIRRNYMHWLNNYLCICSTILSETRYNTLFGENGLYHSLFTTNGDTTSQRKAVADYIAEGGVLYDALEEGEDDYKTQLLTMKYIFKDSNVTKDDVIIQRNIARAQLKIQEREILKFIKFLFDDSVGVDFQFMNRDKMRLDITDINSEFIAGDQGSYNSLTTPEKIREFKDAFIKESFLYNFTGAVNETNSIYDDDTTFSVIKYLSTKNVINGKTLVDGIEPANILYEANNTFISVYNTIHDEALINELKVIKTSSEPPDDMNKSIKTVSNLCYSLQFKFKNTSSDPNYGYHLFDIYFTTQALAGKNLYRSIMNDVITLCTYITGYYTSQQDVQQNKLYRLKILSNDLIMYECLSKKGNEDPYNSSKNYNCASITLNGTIIEGGYSIIDYMKETLQTDLGFMSDSKPPEDVFTGSQTSGKPTEQTDANAGFTENFRYKDFIYITYNKYEILFDILQLCDGIYGKYISFLLGATSYFSMWWTQKLIANSELAKSYFNYNTTTHDPMVQFQAVAFENTVNAYKSFLYKNTSSLSSFNDIAIFSNNWTIQNTFVRIISLILDGMFNNYSLKDEIIYGSTSVVLDSNSDVTTKNYNKITKLTDEVTVGPSGASKVSYDENGNVIVPEGTETKKYDQTFNKLCTEFYSVWNLNLESETSLSTYYDNSTGEAAGSTIKVKKLSVSDSITAGDIESIINYTRAYTGAISYMLFVAYNANRKDSYMFDNKRYDFPLFSLDTSTDSKKCKSNFYYIVNYLASSNFGTNTYSNLSDIMYDQISKLYNGITTNSFTDIDSISRESTASGFNTTGHFNNENYKYKPIPNYKNTIAIFIAITSMYLSKVNLEAANNYDITYFYNILYGNDPDNSPFSDYVSANSESYQPPESLNGNSILSKMQNRKTSFVPLTVIREKWIENGKEHFRDYFHSRNKNENNAKIEIMRDNVKPKNLDLSKHGIDKAVWDDFVNRLKSAEQSMKNKVKAISKDKPKEGFISTGGYMGAGNRSSYEAFPVKIVYRDGSSPSTTSYIPKQAQVPNSMNTQKTKEGFISTGSMGAAYNKDMNTIIGPALYTNQMIQNGQTWKDVRERTEQSGIATDGPNILGAGPGNSYDEAMKAHIRNIDIINATSGDYENTDQLKEINKNINMDIADNPTVSMYNRGNQTCGKLRETNARTLGVLEEKYLPERCKNRNIYRAQEIIGIPGYDIHEDRIGEDLSLTHQTAHTYRSHGRRDPRATPTNALLSDKFGGVVPPNFNATVGAKINIQEGFQPNMENRVKSCKASGGGSYFRVDGTGY